MNGFQIVEQRHKLKMLEMSLCRTEGNFVEMLTKSYKLLGEVGS